ncbi:hypothetical protein C8035_v005142 [Colletotrichum spinosum]|uniref:Uncharacterized protein n=1 Tax=Colletotrichum spinosum TaxID=1347390 RepID=A0A4R8QM27_9PEZI|nr:hypothetical protein C8035_v005142 [Colletotrichum spinosum]
MSDRLAKLAANLCHHHRRRHELSTSPPTPKLFPPDTDSVVKLELALGPRDQRRNHQAPPTVRPSIFWEFAQEHTPSEGSATSDTVFPHISVPPQPATIHEPTSAHRRMALPS